MSRWPYRPPEFIQFIIINRCLDLIQHGVAQACRTSSIPMNFSDSLSLEQAVRQFEFRVISRVLRHTCNNQTLAARLMGISRRTLLYRLPELMTHTKPVPNEGSHRRRYRTTQPSINMRPFNYWQLLEQYEKKQISLALQLNRGQVGKTAEHLSVNRRTLAWKITRLGIDY